MTRPTKLPGLTPVATGNPALDNLLRGLIERSEVREGARGSQDEKVVTHREMKALGLDVTQIGSAALSHNMAGGNRGGVMVQSPTGSFTRVPYDVFADELRKTSLYRDLMRSIDSVNRFDDIPGEVRTLLLTSLADEAQARGAEIRRIDKTLQSTTESLAYTVQEVTAAVSGAAAGVREVSFASATANAATAGRITQVQARLDDFSDGTPGTATIEEKMTATANRTTGLSAQYTLKVGTGGKFAGIGLASTTSTAGVSTSAIIFSADKFALVGPNEVIADTANPPLNRLPFGYDSASNTLYINGQVRISAGGPTIADSAGKFKDYIFQRSASAPATPTGNTPVGWSDTPPAGAEPLYMAMADKTSAGALRGAWSTPVRLDGLVGASGQYTEYQYATGTLAAATGTWADTQPTLSSGVYMWMRARTVTPPAAAGTWGTAVRISGEAGEKGTNGPRGSVTAYATGSSWSDSTASNQIATVTGTAYKTIGDTVTISNGSTFAQTRYWSGTSWVVPGVVIDGNLLVNGTVSTAALSAGTITAEVSISTGGYIVARKSSSSLDGINCSIAGIPTGYGVSGVLGGVSNIGALGVIGQATDNALAGVLGRALGLSTTGIGVWAVSTNGIALKVDGRATFDTGIVSSAPAGTAPISVASSTACPNLNADLLDGLHGSSYLTSSHYASTCEDHDLRYPRYWPCDSGAAYASNGMQLKTIGISGVQTRGSGNAIYIETISDARLKQGIEDEALGLDFVNSLRPVAYRLISNPATKYHGFIAQDFEPLIGVKDDALYQTHENGVLGVDYMSLIAPLTKAIQELTARLQKLEAL